MDERKIDYSKLAQERVVNIREIMYECIRKWWIIAILAVVFAALLGGFKYQKDVNNAKTSVENNKKSEADLDGMKANLSEEELLDADYSIHMKKNLISSKEYLDNSILMQVNPYSASVVTLQYYIDNDYKYDFSSIMDKDYIHELQFSYQTFISNGQLSDMIKVSLFEETDVSYVTELISYKNPSEIDGENSFWVKLIGMDQESCMELSDQVQKYLNEYQSVVSEKIGSHQLKLINVSYSETMDTDTLNIQTAKLNAFKDVLDKTTNSLDTMSAEQTSYIDAQFEQREEEMLGDEAESSEEVKAPEVRVSKKYVVVGAFAGIVLSLLGIVFIYLMKGTINSAEDIQYLYNLKILGKIGRGKLFSKDRISLEQQLQFVLISMKSSMDQQQVKKVYVCGSCLDKLNQDAVGQIKEGAKKLNLSLDFGESYVYNPESLERMLACDSVILLEKEQCSKYTELIKQYRICMEYQKDILGVVVFHV